ncbi:SPFH domain-containing protein [Adlercreutzia caecimuris]|jgi:membrane protease subunit (stomatin/prohibitin family)|uniref:SPFH domain-containing protein n=1 Tax=Adlercreutzia caecimuris TaxID=671266 RepID=UPI001C3EC0A2|nr:SPFH domain-containing protein [Adlercreutzia caecimuris]
MAIVSVVKYDGSPDVFAWKYPDSELGTWTQLIVNESQQAILFKGGQALDVFEAGRHTLSTANIPFLEALINLPFGGQSPFSAEVWFVNKQFNLDVKWGTPSPIQIQDPVYGVFVPVRSHGIFGLQIDDAKRFLVKLVGTLPAFTKNDIVRYFRGVYVSKVKDAISTYIVEHKVGILEINMYLDELSDYLRERIAPTMADYGISLTNFYVNDISVPEDDPAVVSLKQTLAKRAEMNIIGYNYVQERSFDTLEGAATNPGSGSSDLMGAGLGLGMGFGMGGGFGSAFADMARNLSPLGQELRCPSCGTAMAQGQKFCGQCGRPASTPPAKPAASARFCTQCGEPMPEGAHFCGRCGMQASDSPDMFAPEEKGTEDDR